jgi:hypothetical protein
VTLWLDNQLPPALAAWMRTTLSVNCVPVRDLNLHRASDPEIFWAARDAQVVIMTKDAAALLPPTPRGHFFFAAAFSVRLADLVLLAAKTPACTRATLCSVRRADADVGTVRPVVTRAAWSRTTSTTSR